MSKEFKIQSLYLTKNECYLTNSKITPKGIMVHSTGANNPNLRRYVGPDDGILGYNVAGTHWNQFRPGGRQVCVHAFIGLDKDGIVRTYQTLPWNHRGWHCGGTANNTHISFEICEDNLKNKDYFEKVYAEAINLCVYLCRLYNLTEKNIIGHQEGYKKGLASNHADPEHWFVRFGKTMDTFRNDVSKKLKEGDILAKLLQWQKEQGEKALDSLNSKKDNFGNPIVNAPEDWKEKLAENIPGWLFWSIIDRVTK